MKDARETIRRFRKQEADANRYYYRNVVSTDDAEGTRGERYLVERRDPGKVAAENERSEERGRKERNAIRKTERYAPWTTPVLRLIIRNGENRKESIWQLMQKIKNSKRRKTNTTATGRR